MRKINWSIYIVIDLHCYYENSMFVKLKLPNSLFSFASSCDNIKVGNIVKELNGNAIGAGAYPSSCR